MFAALLFARAARYVLRRATRRTLPRASPVRPGAMAATTGATSLRRRLQALAYITGIAAALLARGTAAQASAVGATPRSCQGACGSCWFDESSPDEVQCCCGTDCADFGDCCSNYEEFCTDNTPLQPKKEEDASPQLPPPPPTAVVTVDKAPQPTPTSSKTQPPVNNGEGAKDMAATQTLAEDTEEGGSDAVGQEEPSTTTSKNSSSTPPSIVAFLPVSFAEDLKPAPAPEPEEDDGTGVEDTNIGEGDEGRAALEEEEEQGAYIPPESFWRAVAESLGIDLEGNRLVLPDSPPSRVNIGGDASPSPSSGRRGSGEEEEDDDEEEPSPTAGKNSFCDDKSEVGRCKSTESA